MSADLPAHLYAARDAARAEPDPAAQRDLLIQLLVAVRDLRADLAGFARDVEADLFPLADAKRWVIDGLGEVTVRRSTKRSGWDNEGLTRRVVALALDERIVDTDTGEYEPSWEAVARVLSECARPSWRVTPLRARGIDLDEFVHEEPGAYTVELPPSKRALTT